MALQLYSNAIYYVNSLMLAEEVSGTIDRDSRATQVDTVAKGFAGFSVGAPIIKITVENGVPSLDFELNPGKFFIPSTALIPVTISVFAAGRTLTSQGFIHGDTFQHGVNQEAKLRFMFTGAPADWV